MPAVGNQRRNAGRRSVEETVKHRHPRRIYLRRHNQGRDRQAFKSFQREAPGVSGPLRSGLASLIAIGSIYTGIHGTLHPADAAAGFGIPLHNVSDYAFRTQRI
jgi:hypothetical protein